ncbi:MAG: DUF1015 domain-containing protein [Oscillospiraceae bacterium]
MRLFNTADILLPREADMTKWSCIACDQFTSEPSYWDGASALVGEAPSTLRLILPEAYLDSRDSGEETNKIYAAMNSYLQNGVFREVSDSLVYVERTLPSGAVRRGLVGTLDLEGYDWSEGTKTEIRATEGTVESRLPARTRVRAEAALELPHIMVFIEDPMNRVIPSAAGGEALYDFDLMLGGGHISGSRVTGADAERVIASIEALRSTGIRFGMGDGNHSLAAAKRCWEELKPTLSAAERETHPARRALVELVNIHDSAVTFEPIHRVISGTDPSLFMAAADGMFPQGLNGHKVTFVAAGRKKTVTVPGFTIGQLVDKTDAFCTEYIKRYGGTADYIHGDAEAEALMSRSDSVGILLPAMEKGELFVSVQKTGPLPKKSFSLGNARDKRYYLECRKIK